MSDAVAGPIGILGGTFDPVHFAHLALAHAAIESARLEQVLWIPAGLPPHRPAPHAGAAHRLAMVRLASADTARFAIDASEVASAAASYTVHTLERLRRELGKDRPLVLLMGADAFRGLAGWYRWRDLFGLAHIAVATRPGFPLDAIGEPLAAEFTGRRATTADCLTTPSGCIVNFELSAGTVSATEVRNLIAAGAPDDKLRELLPASVLDYIRHNHLYRT